VKVFSQILRKKLFIGATSKPEQKDRLKTCADVLIISNILMVIINIISIQSTPVIGIVMVMLAMTLAMALIWGLKENLESQKQEQGQPKVTSDLFKAVILLCLFIAVLTINSGLMYVVINPAFQHLTKLVSWYWAVPYLVVLVVMRRLPREFKLSKMLYAGMAMMVSAFIAFMLLGRNSWDYLVVDTLLLGACGIFDLFWWSILGDMLDYTDNPSLIFGVGLSANVLGVLAGGLIGTAAKSTQVLTAEITVMGLTVVCITLAMLPVLNRHLVNLLKTHQYLIAYDIMDQNQQSAILYQAAALEPLTSREQEVLQELLLGKSNREIAAALYITENTVKTHAKNIYSKYDVHSRAELISTILKESDS
jgi:DNA-binding CsgD family transcriptional regulator